MIEFGFLWAFVLLPLPFVLRLILPAAKRQDAALRVPFYTRLAQLEGTDSLDVGNKQARRKLLFISFIWLLLVLAAARPQWLGEPITLPVTGRDLMLAVDISGSMKMEDLVWQDEPATRLTVVKGVMADFIKRRKGDRLGLILFGTQAYLQAPLTFDRNALGILLNEAQIGFAGEKTAIGDAIGLSIKRLQNRPAESRILILLTDGANTAGSVAPDKATELAKQAGIKIHTIGVGADEMLLESSSFFSILGRRKINPSADLDEKLLTDIATQTGGRYFRAHNTEELEGIYKLLDELEPVIQPDETFSPVSTLYMWPLGLAFLLSLLWSCAALIPVGRPASSAKAATDGDATHA